MCWVSTVCQGCSEWAYCVLGPHCVLWLLRVGLLYPGSMPCPETLQSGPIVCWAYTVCCDCFQRTYCVLEFLKVGLLHAKLTLYP